MVDWTGYATRVIADDRNPLYADSSGYALGAPNGTTVAFRRGGDYIRVGFDTTSIPDNIYFTSVGTTITMDIPSNYGEGSISFYVGTTEIASIPNSATGTRTFYLPRGLTRVELDSLYVQYTKVAGATTEHDIDAFRLNLSYEEPVPGTQREVVSNIVEDTWVYYYPGSATIMDTNYNTSIALNYGELDSNGAKSKSYIRIPKPSIASIETITSAKLLLTSRSNTVANDVQILKPDAPWNVSTITWNNQPTNTLLGTESLSAVAVGTVVEINLMNYLVEDSIVLAKPSNGLYAFDSSASTTIANRPKVTYTIQSASQGPTAQYYNGTSWVPATVQIFNGTSWAPTKLTGYTP